MLTHDERAAQCAAEALWLFATSENDNLAWSRSQAYKAQERAFIAVLRASYGLSALLAGRVCELLAEYGPDDSLQGTTSRGIKSYVQFVLNDKGKHAYNRYHY